jgi:glutathione synthase/RimK-type ligase-like ATP-grasp enzyme
MEKIFLEQILSRGITPNEFYLLQCLFNGEQTRIINKSQEIRKLQNKGYVDNNFKITEKVKEIDYLFKREWFFLIQI